MSVYKSKVVVLGLLLAACIVLLGAGALQTQSSPQPSGEVRIIGPEEMVFDWTTDRCDNNDIPDMCARAFRDADGRVQLISTHYINRRMVGDTLASAKRECRVVMNSDMNGDPAMFDDHEWLGSFYTLDGQTIYALVHNEYQGNAHGFARCPSGEYMKCWYNAITFAVSTNKGVSYTHPTAPGHLVACPPYPYEPDSGAWGYMGPSNIVFNPKDEYYYALLHMEPQLMLYKGTCVMRTKTLDDPTSWRAWNGTGFDVQFVNPYAEPSLNPLQHLPQPVSFDSIITATESLTFNTYFGKFLLVMATAQWVDGEFITGFYYSLSGDLVHWSMRKLLMRAELPSWKENPRAEEVVLYPSLIDPDDTSRNFEITGQRPYLYFVRMHPATAQNEGLDRDLVRVQIEFQ